MRRALVICCSILGAACGRAPAPARVPPTAEFLVVTADSTLWVRVDAGGIKLHGAPLRLAQVDGRFLELYVADDDRSFQDAVFISQRVYARDLVRGDSTVIWRDARVLTAAVAWGKQHPESVPLGPDDEEDEQPRRRHVLDVALLNMHDHWLSIRTHEDIGGEREPLVHQTDREVRNVTTGARATLRELFGDAESARFLADGERQLAAARDSAARLPRDQREAARAPVAMLALRDTRFALTVDSGRPGVELLAAASRFTETDPTLVLQAMSAAAASWWSAAERVRHPDSVMTAGAHGAVVRWKRGGSTLLARIDTGSGPTALILRDSGQREFAVATVTGPVQSVIWLDQSPPDSVTRAALVRAFSEAAFYSDEVRTARGPARHARPSTRNVHDHVVPRAPTSARLASRNVAAHDADRREQPGPRLRRGHPEHDRHDGRHLGDAPRARDVRDREHRPRGLP